MAFGRKGAPIGNKNAAGKHHGHFGSGALKTVGKIAKYGAITAAVGGGAAVGVAAGVAGVAAYNTIKAAAEVSKDLQQGLYNHRMAVASRRNFSKH